MTGSVGSLVAWKGRSSTVSDVVDGDAIEETSHSIKHVIMTHLYFRFSHIYSFCNLSYEGKVRCMSGPLRADPWHGCILVKYGSRIDRHRPIADPIRGRRALVHSNLAK